MGTTKQRGTAAWAATAAAVAVLAVSVLTVAAGAVYAAEPAAEIKEDSAAVYAGLGIYTVAEADEVSFLEALVDSSGYVGFQPGFANERIVRSLSPDSTGAVSYFVFTRHFSTEAMQLTASKRDASVLPYLIGQPGFVQFNLEEHQVPDWGWEQGRAVAFTQVGTDCASAVLNEYGTSLTFFKYGYTGQAALIRSFPSGSDLDSVRQALFAEQSLAGASIFRNPNDGSYVVYGEFFQTPSQYLDSELVLTASTGSLNGAEVGVVVENYRAR